MKHIRNRKSLLRATFAISSLVLAGCVSSSTENMNAYDDYPIYTGDAYEEVFIVDDNGDYDFFIEDEGCPVDNPAPKTKKVISSSSPAEPDFVPVKPKCAQVCSDAQGCAEKKTESVVNKKQSLEQTTQAVVVKEKPSVPAPTPVPVVQNKPVVVEYTSETIVVDETTHAADLKKKTTETSKSVTETNKNIADSNKKKNQIIETVVESEDLADPNKQGEVVETVVETTTTTIIDDATLKAEAERQKAEEERQRAIEEMRKRVEEEQAEIERLRAQAEKLNLEKQALEKQELESEKVTITHVTQQTAKNESCEDVKDWVASEGSTLRTLLMEWGDKVGWRVVWNMDRDYTLEAGAVFRGRFVEVAAALLRSFARATPAPKGVFYKGNKVLVVSTREDENAD